MKTISLFLISLVVSANLYANESSKSKTNMKMPKIIGVKLTGKMSGWTSPKDVILKLLVYLL